MTPLAFEPTALRRASGEELEALLKNGLRMRYKPVVCYDDPILTLDGVAAPATPASSSSGAIENPDGRDGNSGGAAPPIEPVFNSALIDPGYPFYPVGRQQLALQWLALDGAAISESDEIKYFGSIIDSRKIGDQLFLISNYQPELEGLKYAYLPIYRLAGDAQMVEDNEELALANEKLIAQASLADLMSGSPVADNCLVTATLTEKDAVTNLLWVTSIDLNTRKVTKTECVAARSSGLYMGPKGLYIGDTDYRFHEAGWGLPFFNGSQAITSLHKFSLSDSGLAYAASGNVVGNLGWQNPGLRMSEQNGFLRVVTTNHEGGDIQHKLSIFEENTEAGLNRPNFSRHSAAS